MLECDSHKKGEVWAFPLESVITRMACFVYKKSLARAVLELESVAQMILQYSKAVQVYDRALLENIRKIISVFL